MPAAFAEPSSGMSHPSPAGTEGDASKDSTPIAWAWQGLAWDMPAPWQVTVLDKGYLRADDAIGPRLEVSWRPRMTISETTLRSRLRKLLGKAEIDFDNTIPPAGSPVRMAFRFLHPDDVDMPAGRAGGLGLVLEPSRGTTAVVLLHGDEADTADAALLHAVVASQAVAAADALILWRAFGVCLATPSGYTLHRFHFRPGHFHLQFLGPKAGLFRKPEGMLAFDRLGPARVLLRGSTLMDWARSFHASLRLTDETSRELPLTPCPYSAPDPEIQGPRCVMWRLVKRRSPIMSWWRKQWGLSWRSFAARMWLEDGESKIMAILAKGEPAMDDALFTALVERYETTPHA